MLLTLRRSKAITEINAESLNNKNTNEQLTSKSKLTGVTPKTIESQQHKAALIKLVLMNYDIIYDILNVLLPLVNGWFFYALLHSFASQYCFIVIQKPLYTL